MLNLLAHLTALLQAFADDRTHLAVETLVLRQQLNVLKRSVNRAPIEDSDRDFWILGGNQVEEWAHGRLPHPATPTRVTTAPKTRKARGASRRLCLVCAISARQLPGLDSGANLF